MGRCRIYQGSIRVIWICNKGVPARESRTGTRLVSPATGSEKKKLEASTTGPQNAKLSILEILLAYTDTMDSGTTPGKPLKPESRSEERRVGKECLE